jgi:hypothetical protein
MKFREIIKGLLNEATPDEIYIKYYSDIDPTTFYRIVTLDPKTQTSFNKITRIGKYAKVLLKLHKLNQLKSETNQDLKIDSTRKLFEKLGIREAARAMMDEHYVIALNALNQINVSESNKKPLKDLADMLLHREM